MFQAAVPKLRPRPVMLQPDEEHFLRSRPVLFPGLPCYHGPVPIVTTTARCALQHALAAAALSVAKVTA